LNVHCKLGPPPKRTNISSQRLTGGYLEPGLNGFPSPKPSQAQHRLAENTPNTIISQLASSEANFQVPGDDMSVAIEVGWAIKIL